MQALRPISCISTCRSTSHTPSQSTTPQTRMQQIPKTVPQQMETLIWNCIDKCCTAFYPNVNCLKQECHIADCAQLSQWNSVLDLRRPGGKRLSVGKGCLPDIIIGTDGSALFVLDAAAIGDVGVGTGLALATTARPRSLGRSLTFHGRTSPRSVASSAMSSLARLGPRCACGKTPDSSCMKGIW